MSILNKQNERSLFWAYELYHSGFKEEMFHLLWTIYYDFFHTLNPSYSAYFTKKYKEWGKCDVEEDALLIVYSLISNLVSRPYNMDVFLIRQYIKKTKKKQYDLNDIPILVNAIQEKQYIKIYKYISCIIDSKQDNLRPIMNVIYDQLLNKTPEITQKKIDIQIQITKQNQMSIAHVLLANVICYHTILNGKQMGKKIYVTFDNGLVDQYRTINKEDTPIISPNTIHERYESYNILPSACMYNIDSGNYLSLFDITRNNPKLDVCSIYYYQWLYHASSSPIWLARIKKYNGNIVNKDKKIHFEMEEDIEAFYQEYGLEPDEQNIETRHKNIQPLEEKQSWFDIVIEYNKNSSVSHNNADISKLKRILY